MMLIISVKIPANFIFVSAGTKTDSKQDTRSYINLPPSRQEEVERLLQEGGGRGWRQLGAALGYEPEQLDLFGRGEAPAHTLLSNWAQKDGSTLGLLCSALVRIERPDVVTGLTCPAQGVSVVWPRFSHRRGTVTDSSEELWLKWQGRHSLISTHCHWQFHHLVGHLLFCCVFFLYIKPNVF